MRLANKVAIVTGAGTAGDGMGNGKATALLLAKEGAKVVAGDFNLKAAEETVWPVFLHVRSNNPIR